jgi:hypothetical protein
MLGEKHNKELEKLKSMTTFTNSELELIDFITKNNRTPNYINERRLYQVLLRLNKKLKMAKEKVLVLSSLFEILDKIKVSNKLVVGDVD